MTQFSRVLAPVALFLTIPASANDTLMPETLLVPLDPYDSSNTSLGELEYRGGLQIRPGKAGIGGISSLTWHDGQLYAVTDDGDWLVITTDEIGDRLVDLFEIETGDLLDERGKPLRRKHNANAEAVTRAPDGSWLVSYEQDHRIWRYASINDAAVPSNHAASALVEHGEANEGLGTLATTPDGWLACGEWAATGIVNCLRQSASGIASFELSAPAPLDERGGVPTDADCASTGVCFVLFRSYSPQLGSGVGIVAISPDGTRETLATWDSALSIDNFEGLAVREEGDRTYLYIVSDNNFSDDQRTLLMKFEVDQRAATTPGVPEKLYKMQRVVLDTEMGAITIALEVERAPITAANFLRYVEEGRFDGTVCYRAMRVNWGEQPNGLLQCGTQGHPDRDLAPIAHEPTSETGLSHTDGALSMARFDPGTAAGDFSIMIKDQIGLDAQPDAEDEALRPGFAVFGHVIEGMDVVHAIHAAPIDPDKGEGFMKGQLLADPVEITNARRAEE